MERDQKKLMKHKILLCTFIAGPKKSNKKDTEGLAQNYLFL